MLFSHSCKNTKAKKKKKQKPARACLIFLFFSYRDRSLPSRLFLYKYSRRSRVLLRSIINFSYALRCAPAQMPFLLQLSIFELLLLGLELGLVKLGLQTSLTTRLQLGFWAGCCIVTWGGQCGRNWMNCTFAYTQCYCKRAANKYTSDHFSFDFRSVLESIWRFNIWKFSTLLPGLSHSLCYLL
jgi:hypothetical protein